MDYRAFDRLSFYALWLRDATVKYNIFTIPDGKAFIEENQLFEYECDIQTAVEEYTGALESARALPLSHSELKFLESLSNYTRDVRVYCCTENFEGPESSGLFFLLDDAECCVLKCSLIIDMGYEQGLGAAAFIAGLNTKDLGYLRAQQAQDGLELLRDRLSEDGLELLRDWLGEEGVVGEEGGVVGEEGVSGVVGDVVAEEPPQQPLQLLHGERKGGESLFRPFPGETPEAALHRYQVEREQRAHADMLWMLGPETRPKTIWWTSSGWNWWYSDCLPTHIRDGFHIAPIPNSPHSKVLFPPKVGWAAWRSYSA